MRPTHLVAIGLLLAMASCTAISKKTPVGYRKPVTSFRTPAGYQAADNFWRVFQCADYGASDQALSMLMQAQAADPEDSHLVELVGLCSFWKVVEHARGGLDSRSVHPLAVQSLQYVEEAGRRDPGNRLIPGFISSARYQLGAMNCDQGAMNQAICEFNKNTQFYPQFHGFVQGWVLTAMLPPDHPEYDGAVEAYFKTLDSCAGIRVPRIFPKVGPIGLAVLAKRSATETVCYDTNIAPHNVEGTLLGLGDALLKKGKQRQARIVYESIMQVPNYVHWPYKELLMHRINNMDMLQKKFVADSGCLNVVEPAMMFQSTICCTGCHATNSPTLRYQPSCATPASACGCQ